MKHTYKLVIFGAVLFRCLLLIGAIWPCGRWDGLVRPPRSPLKHLACVPDLPARHPEHELSLTASPGTFVTVPWAPVFKSPVLLGTRTCLAQVYQSTLEQWVL